jgi:leucyl/phenylalanyl-tRNA--protein transferase
VSSTRKQQHLDPLLVISAYAQGIFPMADPEDGTIHWYTADPRAILEHDDFHLSRSLRATLRQGRYEVCMDTSFEAVMHGCAARQETWINETLISTYMRLHEAGLAHSVEAWQDGRLVGGLYGVALRGAFMGESMFSRAPDASKVCLVTLVDHLKARGYILHDVQFLTSHLRSLGATEVPLSVYKQRLRAALQMPCTWQEEETSRR